MSKWSAIVYGRTHELDYQFLALPKDFGEENEQWAKEYIQATTCVSEQLENHQIWSIFKNKSHCIMGITCMVKDLIDKSKYEFDISSDKGNRDTYVFLGYVFKLFDDNNSESKKLSYIPNLYENIEIFKELIKYISEKWPIHDYDLEEKKPKYLDYLDFVDKFRNCQSISITTGGKILFSIFDFKPSIPLKVSHGSIAVFPNDEDWRRGLWEAIAQYLLYSQQKNLFSKQEISLYLGAKKIEYILRSQNPFLLATVDGIKERKVHNKNIVDKPDIKNSFLLATVDGIKERKIRNKNIVDKPDIVSKLYALWTKWNRKIIGNSTWKWIFSIIYLIVLFVINTILSVMEIDEFRFLFIAVLLVFYLILIFLLEER